MSGKKAFCLGVAVAILVWLAMAEIKYDGQVIKRPVTEVVLDALGGNR